MIATTDSGGKYELLNISLPPALRDFVKRAAIDDDRTMSGQVRFFLFEAARHRGVDLNGNGRPPPAPPPPPPLVEPTPAAVSAAKAKLIEMQKECRRLRKLVGNPNAEWSTATEQRYIALQAETNRLEFEISRAERLIPRAMKA